MSDLPKAFDSIREIMEYERDRNRTQEQATWNSLSKEQQLDVFCVVVSKIVQAEMIDRGSYRHALYTVFGFDLDAYGRAMDAGYLDLHNSLVVL